MDPGQHYGLTTYTAPATEPVTLTELQTHLRVTVNEESELITSLGKAARETVERLTGRSLITQTLRLTLDEFPDWEIRLPRPPLVSVTSITYVDAAGTTQTLSASLYRVDTYSEPGRIEPAYGEVWPSAREVAGAVNVLYVAGYGAAAAVPYNLKLAIKLLVGHWFANREQVVVGMALTAPPIPFQAEALCLSEWTGEY